MSTIVPIPDRVNPPPADTGEIISPGCASFEIATPSNGARTAMSARSVRRCDDETLRHLDLLARECDARLPRFHLRLGRVELCLADDLLLDQLLAPPQRELGFVQPRFVFGRSAARRLELRLGHCQRSAHLRVVQPRQHLAGVYGLALFDEHLQHLAGDLRRNRCPAPRRDVSGRVQHRAGGHSGAAPRRNRRRLDLGGFHALRPVIAGPAECEHDQGDDGPDALAGALRRASSVQSEARRGRW